MRRVLFVVCSVLPEKSGGVLGAFKWTSNPIAFPFALGEPTPMVLSGSHDVNTKEGQLSIAAKLNSNLDGKLLLPSEGDPIVTLVGSHRSVSTGLAVSWFSVCCLA